MKDIKTLIEKILDTENNLLGTLNIFGFEPGFGVLDSVKNAIGSKKYAILDCDLLTIDDLTMVNYDEFDVMVYDGIHRATAEVKAFILESIRQDISKPRIILGDLYDVSENYRNRMLMLKLD